MVRANKPGRQRAALLALLLPLLLSACAGQVVISQTYPDPVVKPLPYRVGVHYAPAFSNYIYEDEEAKLSFEMGTEQKTLYDKVFNAMFLQAIPVAFPDGRDADAELDMVLEPVLQEYAFLTPIETATDFYAVSLKYQLRIYDADGEVVGFWPFIAYGKSRTQLLNKNESLGAATTMALRDAAAAMVSQFRTVLEKEQWKTAAVAP